MKSYATDYGTLKVGKQEELFVEALRLAREQLDLVDSERPSWALTGGSTPKAFYKWVIATKALNRIDAGRILWTTSDERMVDLDSKESNFGNAERLMLDALKVPSEQRLPWISRKKPEDAVANYSRKWRESVSKDWGYDVCFLGMGDDCHTLSLFPGSELLKNDSDAFFAAVNVPDKGWRLTLTPKGLQSCGLVILMTLGAGKAAALKSVLQGKHDPLKKPAQILKEVAGRAIWLVDKAAASKLKL